VTRVDLLVIRLHIIRNENFLPTCMSHLVLPNLLLKLCVTSLRRTEQISLTESVVSLFTL
jgi:hypothetical protein